MKFGVFAVMAAMTGAAALASPAPQQQADRSVSSERSFAEELAHGNVAEIELGKLAEQKAGTAAVRDFGRKMVNDHTELNNQLKEWAQTNHVSLPPGTSTAEADQKRRLEGLSGQAFDRAYMDYMLSDHAHDVQKVQRLAESAHDPQVKRLAEQCLPKLQDHLRLAENVAGQIGIKANKGLNGADGK